MGNQRGHHKNLMGLLGLGNRPPPRWVGVEHRATRLMPEACDKCGATHLQLDGRRVSCWLCGWDVFLVTDRVELIPHVLEERRRAPAGKETEA